MGGGFSFRNQDAGGVASAFLREISGETAMASMNPSRSCQPLQGDADVTYL